MSWKNKGARRDKKSKTDVNECKSAPKRKGEKGGKWRIRIKSREHGEVGQ